MSAKVLFPTVKTISLEQACEVLNRKKHRGFTDWRVGDPGANIIADDDGLGWYYDGSDAIDIAESYLMGEKEAARLQERVYELEHQIEEINWNSMGEDL